MPKLSGLGYNAPGSEGGGGGSISTPVSIANGGTFATSYTTNAILKYDGTRFVNSQFRDDGTVIGVGGLTSSQPALKASSTTLQVRLADDSAFAPLQASEATVNAAGTLTFLGRSKIASGADGNLLLTNNAGNDFSLLRLGGTGATEVAIKRSTTQVHFRLADDSDFCRVNAKSITLTGGTITADAPIINATRTWNNAGVTFTALKLNVTDTASGAASLLMDLQVAGTTAWGFGKTGSATTLLKVNGTNRLQFTNTYTNGNLTVFAPINVSGYVGIGVFGDTTHTSTALALVLDNGVPKIGMGSGTAGRDVFILRDAANTLALRNGTAAQAFHLYNTYTSGSVYERGFVRWASNALEIGTEHVGASARDTHISSSANVLINTSGGTRVTIGSNVVLSNAVNIACSATTGSKIGTTTSQKIGFWNATPIAQPSSTGETTGFTAGSGTAVNDDSTFTGNVGATAYRINDIVKHLKNAGLIAS